MSTDHTRRERETIRDAANAIEYHLQSWSHAAPYQWREALKEERRDRSSIHAARALVVRSFLEGLTKPDMPVSDLWGYAHGCREAMVIGAGLAAHKRYLGEDVDTVFAGLRALCEAAATAHYNATTRALDALDAERR